MGLDGDLSGEDTEGDMRRLVLWALGKLPTRPSCYRNKPLIALWRAGWDTVDRSQKHIG